MDSTGWAGVGEATCAAKVWHGKPGGREDKSTPKSFSPGNMRGVVTLEAKVA